MSAKLGAFLLLASSGLFQAAFALPMKHMRGRRWEHVWAAQSVTANLVFPLLWAILVPGAFWHQAARIPASHWVTCYCWGLLWGTGGIAYGLAVRLGMAFANSFIFGVTILTSAIVPLVFGAVGTPVRFGSFLTGLILCLVTTAFLGVFRRQGQQKPMLAMPFRLDSFGKVVAVAMGSGVLCASYGLV